MGTAVNSIYQGLAPGLNCYGGVYIVAPVVNNPSEDYGINGYFESHIKGTQAGHIYGGGFWVNVDAGFVDLAGGYFICAQDNGIYEAAATTFTNAIYIYGMRAEAVLTSAPSGGLHMFSSNTGNRVIDSIFIMADGGPSLGYVSTATAGSTKLGDIPLAKTSSGTVLWVRVYDSSS